MIVVVDGTGPDDDAQYAREMSTSFCRQIASATLGTYFRGPTLTGKEVSAIADRAAAAATTLANAGKPIYLAGYSRGGCTAIIAAKRLQRANLKVKALFLFDAVDMQGSDMSSSQIISSNVQFVAHARSARSLRFAAVNPVKSRFYFVNTGRWLAGNGVHHEKNFVGTHGAVGGVPWADVAGDAACALDVAGWMSPYLKSQGIDVLLQG